MIYLVQQKNSPYVKIGRVGDGRGSFRKRLSQLQTGHAEELVPVAILPEGSGEGRYSERGLHERFAEYRQRGEWFRLEGELAKFVDEQLGTDLGNPATEEYVGKVPSVAAKLFSGRGFWMWTRGPYSDSRSGIVDVNFSRATLLGVIDAVTYLAAKYRTTRLTLEMGNEFFVQTISRHIYLDWHRRDWVCGNGKPVQESDLWEKLVCLLSLRGVSLFAKKAGDDWFKELEIVRGVCLSQRVKGR